jgi:hypothetical protein
VRRTLLASGVESYMGYQFIAGQELMRKFEEQVRQFPIPLLIIDRQRRKLLCYM